MALRGSAQTNRHAAPPPAVPAPHARTYKAQRPELPHTLRSRQCTSKSCRRRRSPSNPPNLSAKQQVRRSAPQAWTGLTFSFSCLLCFPCQLERLTQQAWSRQGRTKCQRAPWRGRRRAGELLAGTDLNRREEDHHRCHQKHGKDSSTTKQADAQRQHLQPHKSSQQQD